MEDNEKTAPPRTAVKAARQAYRKGDWDRVVGMLTPSYDEAPDDLPDTTLRYFLVSLTKIGAHDRARSVYAFARDRGRLTPELLIEYGTAMYHAPDGADDALDAFETYLSTFEKLSPGKIEKMYFRVRGSRSRDVRSTSFDRATGPISGSAHCAYDALLNKDTEAAAQHFEEALQKCFSDEYMIFAWKSIFAKLCSMVKREPVVETGKDPAGESVKLLDGYMRKISMAGMGWSGSTAIFDYLKEFSGIVPVKGELQFIEGTYGANDFLHGIKQGTLEKSVIDFFRCHLFGFSRFSDRYELKCLRHTRKLTVQKDRMWVGVVDDIMTFMSERHRLGALDTDAMIQVVEKYLQTVVYGGETPRFDCTVMFDNIIHSFNLHAALLTRNMQLFCAFRDPRSNYVARVYEDKKKTSHQKFLERYPATRSDIAQDAMRVKEVAEADIDFTFIQFENFVLSRSYRQGIARKVGLDLSQQDEYSGFQPWVSEKNVFNFESYEKQDEIRLIERQLKDYCVDVHALKRESDNEH